MIDRFADVRILRYRIEGFEALPLRTKMLLYHLSRAALYGRDIFYDQNCSLGLQLRKALEAIYLNEQQRGMVNPNIETYLKRLWFANGPHHHYSNDKFSPDFSREELIHEAHIANIDNLLTPDLLSLIFDPKVSPKKVSLDSSGDLIKDSSVNFYGDNVSQDDATTYYAQPGHHPLNSKLTKDANGHLTEEVWCAQHGKYANPLTLIANELRNAIPYAANPKQANVIAKLVEYIETGDPKLFDDYSILWLSERDSDVDFINGFIEVYDDPLGLKGTWESIVQLADNNASEKIAAIAADAQWFEDHSPIEPGYRKRVVRGVSMRVINAVMLGGDCYPAPPIGVNLPNADWIREQYGSKSITLSNISGAIHDEAKTSGGVLSEFAASNDEIARCKRYGRTADELHTVLHECLGHGSGQMRDGVTLDNLGEYGSTIEEARADLFALYFMANKHLRDLGIVECEDVAWAEYDSYLRSGALVQLARIEEGRTIEEAHMRNRAMIARWIIEQGEHLGYVSMYQKDNKHYISISNHRGLCTLFGQLLYEVQRIKSEGDYYAAKSLIETYGVQIDHALHHEVRERYAKLGIAPFTGFVNPRLTLIKDDNGNVANVELSYNETYTEQMLRYSREYSTM